jgi:phage shock protein A
MTILSRMFRLCKADLHGVMDQMEDKGLLLKQYLREMESALQQKQARQSQLNQTCRQLQRELSLKHQEEEKLETEVALAIRKDKDDIAKILIRKHRTLQACCKAMTRRLELLEEEGMQLARMLDQQQLQYQELKVRAAEYCCREERQPFEEASEMMAESGFSAPLTEEEVELELLKRKEALKQGGGQ